MYDFNRRIFSIILLLFILMSTGCGVANDEAALDPTVLTLWGGVPKEAGPQAVVDLWNSQNSDVKLKYVRYSNDDEGNLKLDTALLNEQDVDLFFNYFSSNYKQRVKMDVVENLSALNIFDIEEKMGHEAVEWKVDGSYYGIPTKKNYYFILLNKDELDKKGLTVPEDWTWDELRDYAKELTTDNQWGFVQYDFVLPYPIDGALGSEGYVKSDQTSNFDHPLVSDYLQLVYDMMYIDQSTPLLEDQITGKMPIDTMFVKGEAAMLFGGEWVLRYINHTQQSDYPEFEVAFAPIPKMNKDQDDFQYIGGLGDAISINKNSSHKEEAVEFIKWYVDEGMEMMAIGGRLPASIDADLDQAISLLRGEHHRFNGESLDHIIYGNNTTQLSLEQELIDLRKREIEKYLYGITTLEETIHHLVEGHHQMMGVN